MRAGRVCALVAVSLSGALPVVGVSTSASATFAGPNGKIAFAGRVADNTTEIYSIDPDGSTLRQLTFAPGFDADPAWSPDGTRIAYARDDGVFVMTADGTGSTRLTTGRDAHPAWSPDGSQLVFQRRVTTDFDLYVIGADGSGETALTADPDTDDAVPSWSPDGQRIAFSRSPRFAGQPDIHVVGADGSNLVRLTTDGQSSDPDWSPDGTRFVFTKGQLSSSDIYVMESTAATRSRSPPTAAPTRWPNGRPTASASPFRARAALRAYPRSAS